MFEFKNTLPAIFSRNVYPFSCAYTQHMLMQINSFLVDESGNVASFSKFKRGVFIITNGIDLEELEEEYNAAIESAQMEDRANSARSFM